MNEGCTVVNVKSEPHGVNWRSGSALYVGIQAENTCAQKSPAAGLLSGEHEMCDEEVRSVVDRFWSLCRRAIKVTTFQKNSGVSRDVKSPHKVDEVDLLGNVSYCCGRIQVTLAAVE